MTELSLPSFPYHFIYITLYTLLYIFTKISFLHSLTVRRTSWFSPF